MRLLWYFHNRFTLKKVAKVIFILLLLILPLLFLFLPSDYFDDGRSICPSKALLNIECLGCGLTRATQHLIHLEFKIAWEYNKLSFLIIPVLIYFYLVKVKKLILQLNIK
jgi:hypothetical protein